MAIEKESVIGITMGDPAGIGPEIILKSFEKREIRNKKIVVIGDYSVMDKAFGVTREKSFKLKRINTMSECTFSGNTLNIIDLQVINIKNFIPGKKQADCGNAAFQFIKQAVELVMKRNIDAIVTAPINKEALQMAGHSYPGHTEILASISGTKDYAMVLHDKKLTVIHVSTHVPLIEAIKGLRRGRIERVIQLGHDIMTKLYGKNPAIAVAGLNPHAGENGLFGNEEKTEIIPAIMNIRGKGINVAGPLPPDTVFLQATNGKYDLVVAMYHDQGHIPLKLLGFSSGVNITAGLPFIRTSVDHGTAFDIAWQGKANADSMVEAIKLAERLF